MFTTLFFTTLYISQYVCEDFSDIVLHDEKGNFESDSSDQVDATVRFPKGIVAYKIDVNSYDEIIAKRIRTAMDLIEASSCLVFKPIIAPINSVIGSWIHFTNPNDIRECVHVPGFGDKGEIIIVLGFECLSSRYVLHAVLHGIGFKDEVSHPQREQYIRILWQNIQPRYRDLFAVQQQDPQYKLVEYDPMSIMHFHDRAFSLNGGPTIAPRVPGLHIKPSSKLSQLDVMKLRMWFGHECNKRKVGAVLEKCKIVMRTGNLNNQKLQGDDVSVDVDDLTNPYNLNGPGDPNNNGSGDDQNGDVGDEEYGGDGDAVNEGGTDEANGGGGDAENEGGAYEANGVGGDEANGGYSDEGNGDDGNEDNGGHNDEMNEVDDQTNADGGRRDDGVVKIKKKIKEAEGPVV